MALVIPAGFAAVEILLRHVSATVQAEITFGIEISGFTGSYDDLADDITTAYDATWGTMSDAGVLIGPTILHIGAASPPYLTVDGTSTEEGNVTGDTMPSNVALLMRKRSTQAGRGGRGRNYLPWVLRDDKVDDVGNIDNGTLATAQTAANDFLVAVNDAGDPDGNTPMVILHDSGASTAADTPPLVTSVSVDALVATQRRRLGR